MNVKRERAQAATQALIDKDIFFTVNNNGWHVVIQNGDEVIDFWPSTGRWRPRDGESKFGLASLLKHVHPETVLCPVCDGAGEGPASGFTCSYCSGKGEVTWERG